MFMMADTMINTTNTTDTSSTITEHEDGEILEDGEIADDDDDEQNNSIVNNNFQETSKDNDKDTMNNNKFGPGGGCATLPPYPIFFQTSITKERNEVGFGFGNKAPKRKKRGDRSKNKRKRSNSLESQMTKQRKFSSVSPASAAAGETTNAPNSSQTMNSGSLSINTNNTSPQHEPISQRDSIDIAQYINDSSFDNVELSDQNEFNFELIEFDVFMEILGCKASDDEKTSQALNDESISKDKAKLMCRIVKIMKKLHGNDPDTARRFARLKRRSREKQNGSSTTTGSATSTKALFKTPCRYYLDGKCHKGNDCLYSHDVPVPKRKELCKFYLQGFCGKGDDCLFMHNEFPCKFFHTNTKCYSGENCRFSHKPLTDENREILRQYLDSGTFPDEVKPYRPINHVNDWLKDDDPDSNDFDYEALLSRVRPNLLGPPTEKMKKSLETWKWQQDLKEAEKAYTGTKRNLFAIDDALAMKEKPRLEDDEDEIEAHIRSYYNDLLDTDDYDEMLHAKEIEEMESRLKAEQEENQRLSASAPVPVASTSIESSIKPVNEPIEMSEEEKRLLEASKLDEDLRILPTQPFTLPPAFQNACPTPPPAIVASAPPVVSAAPSIVQTPAIVSQSQPTYSGFNLPSAFAQTDNLGPSLDVPAPTQSGFIPTNQSLVETAPISAMNPMIVNSAAPTQIVSPPQQQQQPPPPPIASVRDPRILRDPRLNNSNRLSNNSSNNVSTTNTTANTWPSMTMSLKPEVKVIKSNPNLVINYKLYEVKVEPINYSGYYEAYQNDGSLKNDPRLKKFFSNPSPPETLKKDGDEYSFGTKKTESLITLPTLPLPMLGGNDNGFSSSTVTVGNSTQKPWVQQLSSLSPSPLSSSLHKNPFDNSSKTDTANITRDPRMRNRTAAEIMDHHRISSIDAKNSDSNTSIISTSSTDQNVKSDWDSNPTSTPTATTMPKFCQSPDQNSNTSLTMDNSNDRPMNIPSYALSALPTTKSLFSSVSGTGSLLFGGVVNCDKMNVKDNDRRQQEEDDNNNNDDDDDDENQLKVDESGGGTPPLASINEDMDLHDNNKRSLIHDEPNMDGTSSLSIWPSMNVSNIDEKVSCKSTEIIMDSSDNEMEIDLHSTTTKTTKTSNTDDNRNVNNESESEYENELIIATSSSSETEDNGTTINTKHQNNGNNVSSNRIKDDKDNNNLDSSTKITLIESDNPINQDKNNNDDNDKQHLAIIIK